MDLLLKTRRRPAGPHAGCFAGKRHATFRPVTTLGRNSSFERRQARDANLTTLATSPACSTSFMLAQLAFLLVVGSPTERLAADSVRSDRDVRLAALRHAADVKRCYEREGLTRDPRLSGTLDVTVTVLATGIVSDASVASDDMRGVGAREVAKCLTTAIRNWRFDRGPYVVETIVFPFRFAPTAATPSIATS